MELHRSTAQWSSIYTACCNRYHWFGQDGFCTCQLISTPINAHELEDRNLLKVSTLYAQSNLHDPSKKDQHKRQVLLPRHPIILQVKVSTLDNFVLRGSIACSSTMGLCFCRVHRATRSLWCRSFMLLFAGWISLSVFLAVRNRLISWSWCFGLWLCWSILVGVHTLQFLRESISRQLLRLLRHKQEKAVILLLDCLTC